MIEDAYSNEQVNDVMIVKDCASFAISDSNMVLCFNDQDILIASLPANFIEAAYGAIIESRTKDIT